YVLYDTINFNASKKGGGDAFSIGAQGDTIINDIKQVVINCSFLNGMPLDLNTQVFLCDSLLNKLDSLFTYTEQPIVKSAAVSNSGKVTTPAQTNLSIVYNTAARIQKLKSVKKAIIKSIVSTTGKGQKFVKFYSYYRLSVKFSAEVSLKITQKL